MLLIQDHPILAALAVSVLINGLFFIFASLFRTDKVTDLSYSLTFLVLTSMVFFLSDMPFVPGKIVVASAIALWSIRLGSYLLYRIIVMKRDSRFDTRRESVVKFLKFWILQALTVWVVMIPFSLFLASSGDGTLVGATIGGTLIFVFGLIIETIGDIQKFRYKSDPAHRGHWTDVGLWRFSRHPNYFGEILLWWGLFCVVAPSLSGLEWFSIIGPLSITLLICFVTGIPPLERSAEKKYGNDPEYRRYKRGTSILVILPPRKKR